MIEETSIRDDAHGKEVLRKGFVESLQKGKSGSRRSTLDRSSRPALLSIAYTLAKKVIFFICFIGQHTLRSMLVPQAWSKGQMWVTTLRVVTALRGAYCPARKTVLGPIMQVASFGFLENPINRFGRRIVSISMEELWVPFAVPLDREAAGPTPNTADIFAAAVRMINLVE